VVFPLRDGLIRGKSREQAMDIYQQLVKDIHGPLMMSEIPATRNDVERMGYKLNIIGGMVMDATAGAMREALLEYK
jgi:hypothetical protein